MYFLKIKNLRKRYYALPIIYGIVNIFFSLPPPFFLTIYAEINKTYMNAIDWYLL